MIYVILVNWRGYDDTIACLEACSHLDAPPFRVIVVDNEASSAGISLIEDWSAGHRSVLASDPVWATLSNGEEPLGERTLQVLRSESEYSCTSGPFVTWLALEANTGFAAANNAGIRMALADPTCSHAWILNNDTIPAPSALLAMLDRMAADPHIGICGSTLLYYHTPQTIQSLGGVFNPVSGRGRNIGMGMPASALPMTTQVEAQLEYVVGASMLVTRRFLEDIGPMAETYFLYFEELDWSRRSTGRYSLAWARDSLVYHKEGASIGTSSTSRPSDTSLYYYNVNRLRFTRRFHAFLLPVALVGLALKAAVFRARKDVIASRVMAMAMSDFFWNIHRTGKIELRN
jgi:GT2 family glycosyltransferase